ncbi:MAG: hypothetical protein KAS63_01915 [Candidatus Heimdallarchaeota archaeon]|nr:hypothetical protein [Candidatus Heimdallarchaeota archaeon]MCK4954091.1 hypothetical protein [Candidatus Heimdallarchaeota archaeon]
MDSTTEDAIEERAKKIKGIAERFRGDKFSLSKDESITIRKVEEAVLECLNYGWEIDSMLEEGNLTPYEFDQLSTRLGKLGLVTKQLAENHQNISKTMNSIILMYKLLNQIVSAVEYIEDVKYNNSGLVSTQRYITKTGYTVDEDIYYDILEKLDSLLEEEKLDNGVYNFSKLERELNNAIKITGKIDAEVVLNVLYLKPPVPMSEILNSIEILKATIEPIYNLIKGKYFREQIKSAKIGMDLLAKDNNLNVGDTIKIKGLFSRKKGTEGFDELGTILTDY